MRTAAAFLIALSLSCQSLPPEQQPADPIKRDIDRFITDVMQRIPAVPSVALSVVHDGKPYYTHVYGNKSDAAYYIGSTTKAYTGLACAILAQRGKLDLDAPINRYLPEVKGTPADISLRRYLTHTSALDNDAITFRTAFSGEHTQAQLISILGQSKQIKPGFAYDNLGYVVASLVIERVTGKPWQVALDELVFTPLSMNRTTAYMSEAGRWTMAVPQALTRSGEMAPLDFMKNDQMMHAAGGVVTTADDVTRWLTANINRAVLPAAAWNEIQRQQVDTKIERGPFKARGYGFGWYQSELNGEMALFHGGGFEGWRSWFSFLPEKKDGVGVMFNAAVSIPISTMISSYVHDRLLEKPGIEELYGQQLAKLEVQAKEAVNKYVADAEQRAQRSWSLQHTNQTYAGRYENPLYGTLTIEQRGEKLYASIGRLSSVLEPFTEPETARVELTPGSGEVLRFSDSAVTWRDEQFTKRVP
jgi:CubicO group peptidase (beta-lactamase class C family)